jgi:outer membrane protein assembly factor BamB
MCRLGQQIRQDRHALLLQQLREAAARKNWSAVEQTASQASSLEYLPPLRLRALVLAAHLWQEANQPARAVAAWQTILMDHDLCDLQVLDAAGAPVVTSDQAAVEIDKLRQVHGEQVAAAFEKQARDLWERAPVEQRPRLAEQLARQFPWATITRTALRDLAHWHEQAHHPGAAAYAYRRLLTRGVSGKDEVQALLGLARAYEQQGLHRAVQSTWRRLLETHGDSTLDDQTPPRVRDYVTARQQPEPKPAGEWLNLPAAVLDLAPCWRVGLGPGERLLSSGITEGPVAGDLVITWSQGQLLGRSTNDGKPRWRCYLPFTPNWCAGHEDTVLVAGPGGVAGVCLEDGARLWTFAAPAEGRYPHGEHLALQVPDATDRPEQLTTFQLLDGRLFFLQGERRLFALDAQTGKVLWRQEAPGAAFHVPAPHGRFRPDLTPRGDTLLVETSAGRCWALSTKNGQRLQETSVPPLAWSQAPAIVDNDHRCIVRGVRHVALQDLKTGQEVWVYSIPGITTLSGEAPQVVGAAQAILVVIPTNLGYQVQRLDRATGKPLWPRPCQLSAKPVTASQWAIDEEAFYYVQAGTLYAHALADGKRLWEQALPATAASWQVQRWRDCLLVYPARMVGGHFHCRWLTASLQWEGGPPMNQLREFPIQFHEAKTGRLLRRWSCQADRPRGTVQLTGGAMTVLPRIEGDWDGTEALLQTLRITPGGLVTALADQVIGWRCQSAKTP